MKLLNSFISTFKKMSTGKRKIEDESELGLKRFKGTEVEDKQAKVAGTTTPFGIFGRAPVEVMHRIFSFLSATQLISMASSSKAYSLEIYRFLLSKEMAQKFRDEATAHGNHGNNIDAHFLDYGHLLNVCGVVLSSEQRIQLLLTFFNNCKGLVERPDGWGRLFRTVTIKWNYEQRLQFFHLMLDNGLRQRIDQIVTAPLNGELRAERIDVRQKLRGYFLDVDFKDPKDAAFWFSVILRLQHRAIDQAKLLLTLYSPLNKDVNGHDQVDFRNLAEVDILSVADADSRLLPLSKALGKLIHAVGFDFNPNSFEYGIDQLRWTKPEIFNLVEEVTTFPEPWPMQNFVAMLLQTPELIPIAISYRIIHGFGDEAGAILFMLNMIALRWRPSSNLLVYAGLKEALRMLTSQHCATLYEKVMHEQLKYIQENWPLESSWNQASVRLMDNAFNSLKEILGMFQVALPLTFTSR